MVFDLLVIGGGAAGFFGAIQAAEMKLGFRIKILEKTTKVLAKVRISGSGRCNVTHNCFDPVPLSKHYPRGEKFLKSLFKEYNARQVVSWFENNGVAIKAEEDGRMFPVTNSSQTIIDSFMSCANKYGIELELGCEVIKVERKKNFVAECRHGKTFTAKNILIAIGGHAKAEAYDFVRKLGHQVAPTVPSLFTFNDSSKKFVDLMGLSVPNGFVRIASTKFQQEGPVLITHWGLSGPAVIKLSAWAAEYLFESKYEFTVLVSWAGKRGEDEVSAELSEYKQRHGKRTIMIYPLFDVPQRLWARLCEISEISEEKIWAEISNKCFNKLIESLIRMPFYIQGKTTFKEEFVTCGGISLSEVDGIAMESKLMPGVYFAGEVLNIDGETGGFNFQSAWTTAYLAARHITKS